MAYCHQCGAAVTPTNLCPKCGAARRQPHDDAAGSADSTAPEPQAPATPEVVDPTIASPRFGSRTGPGASPPATPAVSNQAPKSRLLSRPVLITRRGWLASCCWAAALRPWRSPATTTPEGWQLRAADPLLPPSSTRHRPLRHRQTLSPPLPPLQKHPSPALRPATRRPKGWLRRTRRTTCLPPGTEMTGCKRSSALVTRPSWNCSPFRWRQQRSRRVLRSQGHRQPSPPTAPSPLRRRRARR